MIASLHTTPVAGAATGLHYRPAPKAAQRRAQPGAIELVWARHLDEVRAAQRLRYSVFALELGARLTSPIAGHDVDLFDEHCEHLLARDAHSGQVLGTYRLLTPVQAQRLGSSYSDTEFDLTRLRALRPRMAELGRSCVHPGHRQGAVILALWGALLDFMQRNRLEAMLGCASIPMLGGGAAAAAIWQQLRKNHLAPVEHQVFPRLPLPVDQLAAALPALAEPPALIKGYLRLGARVLGAPAWDPDFNTADLPMLLQLSDLQPRYRRHFLGEQ